MQLIERIFAILLAAGLILAGVPAFAEETAAVGTADARKLEENYEQLMSAINAEDYETAREYLNICFVYCDPHSNPGMYAHLLLKRAGIDVNEGKYEMALMNLEAALRIQPDLADAYLMRTQVCTLGADFAQAAANLEKYIELTQDSTMYETVAQLYEANGNPAAAQEAYDKYVAATGDNSKEAGLQAALYRIDNEQYAEAAEALQAYAEDEIYGAAALYYFGLCKMQLKDYTAAIEAYNACEKKGGTSEPLYYNRGLCWLLTEQLENAAADFALSAEKEPFTNNAVYYLAVCQMELADYAAAAGNFTKLIGDGTTESAAGDDVYYFRAICNGSMGNLEAALADLTVCVDHGYELATVYARRAEVYAALGDTANHDKDMENAQKQTK